MGNVRVMRDVFIERVYRRMSEDDRIFFVTADFGSPKLDMLRRDFPDRFMNVGIAEQNLVNAATGIALEGFTVYAYAIAPFLTMRAFEQIRNNLSLLAHTREVNVNLIGVGAGVSYDVSGPTHHCLEDLTIMRALPNIQLFSPSDWVLAERFLDYSINVKRPKYMRLDAKPLPSLYDGVKDIDLNDGFHELGKGEKICLVSTGYMSHAAMKAVRRLAGEGVAIGLLDFFLLKPVDDERLFQALAGYDHVITLEEGFINKGGLDSLVSAVLEKREAGIGISRIGFEDSYVFNPGSREYLHMLNGLDETGIIKRIRRLQGA